MNNFKKIYNWLRHPGDTLSQRVVHGGVWVFGLRIVNRGFGLIRTIILARLLAPEDFGLFGIAMLALSTLQSFSQTGFNAALIQKKEDTEPYLDTAWTVQIIRGTLLAAILVAGAPLVGAFFEEPRAVLLVRVLAGSVFLGSLKNIGIVYFQKELEFHKQFVYQFSGTVADLAVAIPAAFIFRSVWALIFGLLARNIVWFLVSYLIHEYRPGFKLDLEKSKELLNFGRWIFGSSILLLLINQGDDIFVGKLLGTTALGFYQLAYRISNLPATEITHVISQISFPAYSKLQDKLAKLRKAYLQVLQVTAFLSFPLAGGIVFLAFDFTQLFLGEKWIAIVPALQALAFWGLIRSIGATTGPLFQAVGRPDLATKLQALKVSLLIASIYPLTMRWGILGTSLAVVLNALVVNPIADYLVIKTVKCRLSEFIKMLSVPSLAVALMLGVLSLLKYVVLTEVGFLGFFMLIFVGVVVYLGVIQTIDIFSNYGIKSTIQKRVFSSLETK